VTLLRAPDGPPRDAGSLASYPAASPNDQDRKAEVAAAGEWRPAGGLEAIAGAGPDSGSRAA